MKRKQTLSVDWPCPENSKANMPVCLLTKPLLRGTSMFWNSDFVFADKVELQRGASASLF